MKPAFLPASREQNLRCLREAPLDVLIVGGGINGAGIARDFALRAKRKGMDLRIGLVEKRHFASGTSGKNSHLIHGGLRYLKYFEFSLVQEALHERAVLLRIAPHLVEPLPLLLPFYGWSQRFLYGSGLWMYDLLAGARNIGRHRILSREEVEKVEPGLSPEGLVAGASFYDCRVNSSRLLLENIFDAARDGAIVANYAQAELEPGGAAVIRDALGGESFRITARKIIDATGPWAREPGLRLVRGSHLVLPRLNRGNHALAYFEPSGRIIFVIPWGAARDLSLVGTTDVDHDAGPDHVAISAEETRYLLEIAGRLFPQALGVEPIAAFSSLRPLIADSADSPTAVSREHKIWNSDDGVLHVSGGKYTTYRAMSAQAVDLAMREVAPELEGACATAEVALGGNSQENFSALIDDAPRLAEKHGLDSGQLFPVLRDYGVASGSLLALLPASAPAGLGRLDHARLLHAVRHEMARRLTDLLFVSTYWGYERRWCEEDLAWVASAMAAELDWSQARIAEEIALVRKLTA